MPKRNICQWCKHPLAVLRVEKPGKKESVWLLCPHCDLAQGVKTTG